MPLSYDAVVFDLDGTLVDTESLCNAAGVEACATLGLPVSAAFFESLAGIDDRSRARLIEEHVGRRVGQAVCVEMVVRDIDPFETSIPMVASLISSRPLLAIRVCTPGYPFRP